MVPALVLLAVVAVLSMDPIGLASRLRETSFDLIQRLTLRTTAAETPIKLVEIDEASLARLGSWPWPRTRYAELLAVAEAGGARAILLDAILDETDPTSPATVNRHLENFNFYRGGAAGPQRQTDYDRLLGDTLGRTKTVLPVGASRNMLDAPVEGADTLPWPRIQTNLEGNPESFLTSLAVTRPPLSTVHARTRGLGFDAVQPDADGMLRRLPLVAQVGGGIQRSDVAELLRLGANAQDLGIKTEGSLEDLALMSRIGVETVSVGGLTIPVTPSGEMRLFARHPAGLDRLSAWRLLERGADATVLENALVVIAPTAPLIAPRYETSSGLPMTSGEIKAMALDQILAGSHLIRPDWAPFAEGLGLIAVGVLMVVLVMGGLTILAILVGLLACAAFIGASAWTYLNYAWLIDGALPALGVALLSLSLAWARISEVASRSRHMLSAIGGKLPSPAVTTLATGRTKAVLTGQLRKITVMFCDLRNYATFSEVHRDDPAWMAHVLQRFHTYIADAIIGTGGVADTHQGTAVMGFWNAPVDDPEHTRKACDCALKLIEGLDTLNREVELESEQANRPYFPLNIAVGINTGHSLVGNLGSDRQVDYSALGDPVVIARRLQAYSEIYGPAVIVGEHTFNAVKNRYALLELDRLAVEGRDYSVKTFALMGNPVTRANPRFKALQDAQAVILDAYRSRDWARARAQIAETRTMRSAIPALYDFYEKRIQFYEANPPAPDWDGVFYPPVQ